MLDVAKIPVKVVFNHCGSCGGVCVAFDEAFSEGVQALVVFVFEAAFSDGFDELWHIVVGCVFFEGIPNGVVSWGSGVGADGLFYQGFPPVGAVVHPLSEGCVASIFVGGVV